MNDKRASRNLLLAAAIAVALPAPAFAQQGAVVMEEIIVTARKREETLQDVPLSVSAYTGADLEEFGVADIVGVAQQTPNVTLEASRATNSTLTAFIRGVGQQDPVAGFEGGVGLYLDDVYLARPQGALFDVYDVERIEVLRGPQGTLYGRNTIGGAIKYVTRRLSEEPEGKLRLSLGSYGQTDLVAMGSTPITDSFRIGATFAGFQRGGFGKNLFTGADQYDKDISAFRVSMEWTPNDNLFVRLSGDYSDDSSSNKDGHRLTVGATSGAPILKNVFNSRGGIMSIPTSNNGLKQSVEQKGGSLVAEWTVNDSWTLKSVTAYRKDKSQAPIDFDSLPVDDLDVPAIYDNDQFSQEFQVNYSSDRLSGVFGAYYLDANAFDAFDVVLGQLFVVGVTSFTLGDFNTKAWAAYADLTFDITDSLSASLGGRYTSDERKAHVNRATYLGKGSPYFGWNSSPLPGAVDFDGKRKDTDFSPRVSIGWKPVEAHNLYVSYSQGFKGGSFDPRGNYANPDVQKGFAPETLDSYEIGAKSAWAGGRLTSNIAVFYSDYQDVQVPGSVGVDANNDGINESFVGTVTNAGKAEVKGVEFEGMAQFTDAFSANLSVGYIDAEYTRWIVNDVDISGSRNFQNTPKWNGNLTLKYSWPVNLFGAGGDLALIGAATYRDKTYQFEIPVPLIDQKAYSLYDASLVWTSGDGRYQLGVHGKNLGDERYKVAGYNFPYPTLGLEGTVTAFYGNPRTVTGTFTMKF